MEGVFRAAAHAPGVIEEEQRVNPLAATIAPRGKIFVIRTGHVRDTLPSAHAVLIEEPNDSPDSSMDDIGDRKHMNDIAGFAASTEKPRTSARRSS